MTEETKREQTLLEAAKAMDRLCMFTGTSALASRVVADLRAAIAREDAKRACPSSLGLAGDRAQQAEADAKWHREESARLSAELAKERERTVSTATNWRRQVDQVREEAEAAPDEPTIDAIASLRQRAEKAEAERDLAKNRLALAVERSERQSALIQSATQASGCHMPADVPDSIRGLRARAEKAEAELAKLIDMKVTPVVFTPEPSKVEMQTHAFGSNVVVGKTDPDPQDVRDPATGWTFATYRRVVEALGGKP